jgi:hypothetical protein
MPHKKGVTNNPNGRKKGVPNKSTTELRELLQVFIEENMDDLQDTFARLEPWQKLTFFEKMLKMVLPPPITTLEQLSDEDLIRMIEILEKRQQH